MTDLIPAEDLLVECWPPRETGGQQVGWTSSGIRITHLPTGIQAFCDYGRGQHRNRMIAMEMIEAAITSPNLRGSYR